ncbi:hypothetical protein G6F57_014859 [Rhizopus arrhizus]|nr:hypothetical protein G6F57_014859 [Rhizopus arrhizus]
MGLEDASLFLFPDPWAAVNDSQPRHLHAVGTSLAGFDPDRLIGGGILDGVVDQIAHDDAGQRAIAIDGQVAAALNHQGMRRIRLHRRHDIASQLGQIRFNWSISSVIRDTER